MHILSDEAYMRRCLQLAVNGMQNAKPNPMVGAVIVAPDGRIIGEGYHVRCGEGHAEVNAFASVKAEDECLLPESTIYVSLEPCSHYGKTPPCAELIIKKGVKRVVCGCVDPFAEVSGRGIEMIRRAGIEVTVGVLEKECLELNRKFITFNTLHRPYILLKWAQTADGFIGHNPEAGLPPLAISTPFTKMLVHKLRSEYDAILVGRVTDETEHPQLNVRLWAGNNPRRIVLSSKTSPQQILDELYQQKLQSLMVEGGAKTLNSFIELGLWDEIRVETAPFTIGKGVAAPKLPKNAVQAESEIVEGNEIKCFFHPISAIAHRNCVNLQQNNNNNE